MATLSKKQQLREAIVAILDRDPGLAAFTQRTSGNLVAWNDLDEEAKPVVAYQVLAMTKRDGTADQRRAVVHFSAIAVDESTANEMIAAVDAALTTLAFAALAAPMAAIRLPLEEVERAEPFDLVLDVARADLDAVLHITFPLA